jgi:FkbM family methyltransferase
VRGDGISDRRSLLRHPDPSQLLYQVREIFEERVYLQHGIEVTRGDVVLDVGANIGVAAAFFAGECDAIVHSFEPVQPIYEILCENVRSLTNCFPHNVGLSSRARRARITYYPHADAMSGLFANPDADRAFARTCMTNIGMTEKDVERNLVGRYDDSVELECELDTVSAIMEELGVGKVALLKVDVERAELDVLEGVSERDWPRIEQVVTEVHDEVGRLDTVQALLARHGFDTVVEQEPAMRTTGVHLVYATRR